jgi:sec-independent protein translocase protein TatB
MFGLSWSEILIIGIVALVFIGPNDLPRAMKTAAKWMSAGRKLAREFQGHVDELVREAELDELREQARQLTMGSISSKIEAYVDPDKEISKALSAPEELLTGPLVEAPPTEIAPPVEASEPDLKPDPNAPPAAIHAETPKPAA